MVDEAAARVKMEVALKPEVNGWGWGATAIGGMAQEVRGGCYSHLGL